MLFNRLWNGINPTVNANLNSRFRTIGIHSSDSQAVFSMLPTMLAVFSESYPPTGILSDGVLKYRQANDAHIQSILDLISSFNM